MAQLPDTLPLDAPRGERTPAVAPNIGDLGLGAVANDLSDLAATHRAVNDHLDDRTAQARLDAVHATFQPGYAADAAALSPSDPPGFAQKQIANLDAAAQPVIAAEKSPGVRRALAARYAEMKHQLGEQAIGYESSVRAKPIAELQAAFENSKVAGAVVKYAAAMAPRRAAILDQNIDGQQMAAQLTRAHDEAAAEALDGVDPTVAGRVQSELDARRVEVSGGAQTTAYERTRGYILQQVDDQGRTLANAVLTDPGGYDNARKTAEAVVAGAPPYLQAKLRYEITGEIATARVQGLVDAGKLDDAEGILKSGQDDAWFKPGAKEALENSIAVERRRGQATTQEAWQAHYDATQKLAADAQTLAATGKSTGYDPLKDPALTPEERFAGAQKLKNAQSTWMTTGGLGTKSNGELAQIVNAAPPTPQLPDGTPDPAYADKLQTFQLAAATAAQEVLVRAADPAAAVLRSKRPGDIGDQATAAWTAFTGGGGKPADLTQAARYARLQLIQQDHIMGTPIVSLRVLTKDQASSLVAGFDQAEPQNQPAQLAGLANMVSHMPAQVHLPSGQVVSARQLVLTELDRAGLSHADVAAIADLADNRVALHSYALARADPRAGAKLQAPGQESLLRTTLTSALAPYNQSANALPGADAMAAGRETWTMAVARNLVLHGMSPADAAKQAAAPFVSGYRFDGGLRVPRPVADATSGAFGVNSGLDLVRAGVKLATHDLTENGGAMLYAAGNPGEALTPDQKKARLAAYVQNAGRWVATGDDQGAQLMVPQGNGYIPVSDKYGRSVVLSWDQLQKRSGFAGGRLVGHPNDPALKTWLAPPPPTPRVAVPGAPAGTASPSPAQPAYSNQAKFHAITAALEAQESAGQASVVSSRGATGLRQLLPDTARAAAARMGVAYSPSMLTDPTWNRRLGDNEIQHLLDMSHGSVPLALAAYNAGAGRVFGYTKSGVHHPGWLRTIGDPRMGMIGVDDWVSRIPFAETRDYVRRIMPHAVAILRRGG